jgi:hypothetical protein
MVFFTNLDPKLKDNKPPIIMTIRKLRISLVLKDNGRSLMLNIKEDPHLKLRIP